MKKKIFGAAVLIVGTGAALAAAAIPAASVTASPEPVPGIIRQAEAYATADPIAEKGMQEAVRLCMAKAGFDYTPPTSESGTGPQRGHRIQTAHGRRSQSQRLRQYRAARATGAGSRVRRRQTLRQSGLHQGTHRAR